MKRSLAFGGLDWGPPVNGNCHIMRSLGCMVCIVGTGDMDHHGSPFAILCNGP